MSSAGSLKAKASRGICASKKSATGKPATTSSASWEITGSTKKSMTGFSECYSYS